MQPAIVGFTGACCDGAFISQTSGGSWQYTVLPKHPIASSSGARAVASDAATGTLVWGNNGPGVIGSLMDDEICYVDLFCSTTPRVGVAAPIFTQFTMGHAHSCGLVATGAAYCWGRNDDNYLGAVSSETCQVKTTGRSEPVGLPVRLPGQSSAGWLLRFSPLRTTTRVGSPARAPRTAGGRTQAASSAMAHGQHARPDRRSGRAHIHLDFCWSRPHLRTDNRGSGLLLGPQ